MNLNSNEIGEVRTDGFNFGGEVRGIFRNVFDFFGVLDKKGIVIDLDGTVFEQTNTDPALLIGQRFAETVFWQASENTPKLLEKAIQAAAHGETIKEILDFRISSDKKVAVELLLQPLPTGEIFMSAQQIAKRQHRVEYYKRELEELLFAAENADIGLWYWDLKDDKIYSTPKCNELFEIPAYDVLTYEAFLKAVHPDDRERVDISLRKAHVAGTKYSEEYRVLYSDGSIEWVASEGKSFLDDRGEPEKMTSVVRKVTEQKLANDELSMVYDRERKARAEAVDANRAKDFFLAFVSHELRSPLNAILGWSKILLTKDIDADTRKNALETIERSARFQTKLINDLVDSARVASGKLSLEFRPTNLYEIVRVSFHSQKPSADAHGLDFELTSDSEDLTMFGDAGRLQQVFSNVISNAIKFTPEGGRVSISITSDTEFAKVRIEDTGQGISPDALPFIFRQFSQGDLNQEKSRSGLGLGLSIVKILVGKHGGTVEAESQGINKGAAFTVILPLSRATEGQPTKPRQKERRPAQALSGMNILIVEDDADSREVLQLFLEQSGAIVQTAESVREAFRALGRRQDGLPDLIISDLAMPDEDGYSMMTKIRQLSRENGGQIPAIALSAFTTNESKEKAREAGFQTYATKPFDPEILINDILALAQPRS